MPIEIPDVVVQRLPRYLRALRELRGQNVTVVSSQHLGERLQVTPAQIRKDLSFFGRFGKQGRGYDVVLLIDDLHQILGLDRGWTAILVGAGRLGRAILEYPGFSPEGFHLVAAFDLDETRVGSEISGTIIRHTHEIERFTSEHDVDIAIIAVPADGAQAVVDELAGYGVRGFLSYAPVSIQVPEGAHLRTLDPILAMETMTFYIRGGRTDGAE